MHQSWMLSNQWRYQASHSAGTNVTLSPAPDALLGNPSSTAARQMSRIDRPGKYGCDAGAGFVIATNHWSVNIGSTTSLVRPQRGTIILCGFSETTSPSARKSASTALRATYRSSPRYFSGAFSLTFASRSKMESAG